jgi:integrase
MNMQQTMVDRVNHFVRSKRSVGFQLKTVGGELLRFARYADAVGHSGPITTELILDWAHEAAAHSRLYQARRVEMARTFAKFEAAFEPDTQIPLRRVLGPAHQRIEPYLYTDQQVTKLLAAALRLQPVNGLRPRTYATLVGLIASTGIRVGEACRLQRGDFRFEQRTLRIRNTKFHKSRIVPIHETTAGALQGYVRFRDRYKPSPSVDSFLLSEQGRAISTAMADYTFRKLRDSIGCRAPAGRRPPRLYDLRHTFACKRLLQWYHDGVDLNTCIAHLCTYLGHVKPTDTYWYLSATPELMAVAAKRFENYVKPDGGTTP